MKHIHDWVLTIDSLSEAIIARCFECDSRMNDDEISNILNTVQNNVCQHLRAYSVDFVRLCPDCNSVLPINENRKTEERGEWVRLADSVFPKQTNNRRKHASK